MIKLDASETKIHISDRENAPTNQDKKLTCKHDEKEKEPLNPPTELATKKEENTTVKSVSTSKKGFAKLALVKLWFVLLLTIAFLCLLLFGAQVSHSLTLRVETYHSLYNLMALAGCLAAMRISGGGRSLKNTFGWARLDVLSSLFTLLFLSALCFGVVIDCIQTAAHVGHQDAMHHPLQVIAVSAIGLCLNALVFCLIGGYTHHQGCFLEQRSSGVWIQQKVPQEAVQTGMRTLSDRMKCPSDRTSSKSYQGIKGILRDVSGLILCTITASIVQSNEGGILALYVDPALALLSVVILVYLSFPFGKECAHILLQTIPGNIDVESFSKCLMEKFPEIVNIHHLHIWSLTPGKVIATAHIVYLNPKVYRKSFKALESFFLQQDITQVTLQPEFLHLKSNSMNSLVKGNECLLRCTHSFCHEKECCSNCDHEDDTLHGNVTHSSPEEEENKNHSCSYEKCACTFRTSNTSINISFEPTTQDKPLLRNIYTIKAPTSLWNLRENTEKASSFLSLKSEGKMTASKAFSNKFSNFLLNFQKISSEKNEQNEVDGIAIETNL